MASVNRQAIDKGVRLATDIVMERIADAVAMSNAAQQTPAHDHKRYFEGFEDGLKSVSLHVEDALQHLVAEGLITTDNG